MENSICHIPVIGHMTKGPDGQYHLDEEASTWADIPAEQYPPVARLLCKLIQEDMTWFDPTTAQAERMMYWAAHCQDVAPVWFVQDGPLLDAADLLARQLPTWKDPGTWPGFPKEQRIIDRATAKQQDPTEKTGIVGAFCRAYDAPAAMDKFLPGVYERTDDDGRYTFTGGSTWGGAVLYDGGKFVYSFHATDPAGGKLCNAFDLVRLHRFGALDDGEDVNEDARGNRLPSWAAMAELAQADEDVANELAKEKLANAKADFRDEDAALELAHYAKKPFDLDILRTALRAMGTHVQRNLITGKVEIRDTQYVSSHHLLPDMMMRIGHDYRNTLNRCNTLELDVPGYFFPQ